MRTETLFLEPEAGQVNPVPIRTADGRDVDAHFYDPQCDPAAVSSRPRLLRCPASPPLLLPLLCCASLCWNTFVAHGPCLLPP